MVHGTLMWLLGFAKYLLAIGLLLLGVAAYATFKADNGGGIPTQAELTRVSGTAAEAREVTVQHKRRRSSSTEMFYELDFKPDGGGDNLKLRVDHDVPVDRIKAALDGKLDVRYEPGDVNLVYAIKTAQVELLSYAEMARLAQVRADKAKASEASAGSIGAGIALTLLGGAGVAYRRKRVAQAAT